MHSDFHNVDPMPRQRGFGQSVTIILRKDCAAWEPVDHSEKFIYLVIIVFITPHMVAINSIPDNYVTHGSPLKLLPKNVFTTI
jgi:hypothetical protein